MSTTAKTLKDKPNTPTSRLVPRPTAASAARAARNATNRNLSLQPLQNKSPSRPPSSPSSFKISKNVGQRSFQKAESNTDVKDAHKLETEIPILDNNPHELKDPDEYIAVKTTNESIADSESNVAFIQESNETDVFEEMIQSRPVTPAISSRPQTPSVQSSRPQTPHDASRPTTPVHPLPRSIPSSRPNTPQSLPTRSRTPPSLPSTVCNTVTTYGTSPIIHQQLLSDEEKDLKSTYLTKQRLFHNLKKELDIKQQAVLEVFDCLKVLREQLSREGNFGSCGDDILHKELIVFNVADWSSEEVAQLCRDAWTSSNGEGVLQINTTNAAIQESALAELEGKLLNVPACFADLCLQAFTTRQEIIDWVKELIKTNAISDSTLLERIACYNTQGLEFCEDLGSLKARADEAVKAITHLSKEAIKERSTLTVVGESLVREIEHLRQNLEARASIINEMPETRAGTNTVKALEDIKRELEEEKTARIATKDKLSATESQLRQAKARISKMDRQLREAEASISSLTGTVKSLEDQSRQREIQLEARARKLKESLKTGEVASSHLAQQRDSLQKEVSELKEQIEKMTIEHKSTVKTLNDQIKELKSSLEEKSRLSEKEMELRETLEKYLTESQNKIEELNAKIIEIENSKPNPDLPTEREMDLWAELQATKETLRMTEDEVALCKMEKTRFLESLTKIAESDNEVGLQQKLAAELRNNEDIMAKMQIQIRDLMKNLKLNEQKVIQYEQYVRELQTYNRGDGINQESTDGINYPDLQKETLSLRMSLLEAVHKNEELSEMLLQKEQQLEQQDKTSRAQARVLKVREELINMLKNKETEQSRELTALQQDLERRMKIVDEVNKQIASKAVEIQELFATLENKQQQIHRLEKIVLALEEQQRRAQAQRTRHEEKIAALEHELAAGGNHRERKFLFF